MAITRPATKETAEATCSVDEAHELIGKAHISRGSIYYAIQKGKIPSLQIGTRRLIPRAWLLDKLKGK